MRMPSVIFRYDGSFEGFLCCVFDSYVYKEYPAQFQDEAHLEHSLFPARWVGTDARHAQRILVSLEKIDPYAKELVVKGFLTCVPDREKILYQFIRALYDIGQPLLRQLSDEAVLPLLKAVRHLDGEVHLLKGFTRFSEFEGMLAGEIRPHPPGGSGPQARTVGDSAAGQLSDGRPLRRRGPVPPALEAIL